MLTSSVECERLERQADLHGRDRVLDHIHLEPGMRFLDAGSGSGWVARHVAARFPEAEIVGVDLSPAYVAYAQKRAAAEGLNNVTFEQGDLQDLRFAPATFDVVWSQFVLYFLEDPKRAMQGFRRITKPGGKVVAALHQLPAFNFPTDAEVLEPMGAFTRLILAGLRPEAMPLLFHEVGLTNVRLNVQLDSIYSKLPGPADATQLRNVEEVLSGPMQRMADRLGGAEAARNLLRDWIAYVSRPDTATISTYWVASGTVPR
jgi:ubiquinone/menaquinone biosynthesis C-methylase UbiE